MKKYLSIVLSLLLFIALSVQSALGQLLTKELPSTVTTTIAHVAPIADGEAIKVLADKDSRVLEISSDLTTEIADLLEAQKEGHVVELVIEKNLRNNRLVNTISSVEFISYGDKKNLGKMSYAPNRAFRTITAKSTSDLKRMFNSYYPYKSDYYDVDDNCYNRAHYWARTLQYQETRDTKHFGTKKIFIFFSDAYQSEFDHKWWYHVAPVVQLENASKPHVLDSTFLDQPVTVKGWLETFDGHTDGKCKQINSVNEVYSEKAAICMYIISDMYSYTPDDLEYRPTYWRCSDFSKTSGVRSFTAPGQNTINKRISWDDAQFSYLVPNDCE